MRSATRDETFTVLDGYLVRTVVPARGRPYKHRFSRASFEQVAHAVDEIGDKGLTLETLIVHERLPFTQVAVALAFLRERSILDAMTEFYALAETV